MHKGKLTNINPPRITTEPELPVLQKIYTDYGRRIRMVCISREESSAEIVRYWNENHLTLPYSAQENRTVYYQFAKSGIPRVYVIDKELVIRSVFTDNPLASYEDLAEAITASL